MICALLTFSSRQGTNTTHAKRNAFHNGSHGMVVLLEHVMQSTRSMSNDEHVVQEIHDILQSYYKVSRKSFVDSVCKQSAMHYLLGEDGPLALFSPIFVSQLSESALDEIAGEPQAMKRTRAQLTKEIGSLSKAMKILMKA
jgi:hypothetical protein